MLAEDIVVRWHLGDSIGVDGVAAGRERGVEEYGLAPRMAAQREVLISEGERFPCLVHGFNDDRLVKIIIGLIRDDDTSLHVIAVHLGHSAPLDDEWCLWRICRRTRDENQTEKQR